MKSTFFGTGLALLVASTTIFARDDIRVYTVPKEKKSTEAVADAADNLPPMAHQAHATGAVIVVASIPRNGQTWFFKLKGDPQTVAAAKPAFQQFLKSVEFTDSADSPAKWKAPADWQERPASQMVLGSFSVPGKDGGKADVSITSFPGDVGGEMANVDRWRQQVGLPAASEPPKSEPVTVGGVEGKLYVIGGETSAATAEQDPHAGLNIPPANSGADAQGAPAANATSDGPQMAVPSDWKEKAPGPMVLKSYTVTGSKGGQATVSVSSFPGDVGGKLGNANRWRAQMGLAQVDDSQLSSAAQDIETQGSQGYIVDVEGTDSRTGKAGRLVAAAIPHDGNTWFYKLSGDKNTVEESKESFLKFVKTVRY